VFVDERRQTSLVRLKSSSSVEMTKSDECRRNTCRQMRTIASEVLLFFKRQTSVIDGYEIEVGRRGQRSTEDHSSANIANPSRCAIRCVVRMLFLECFRRIFMVVMQFFFKTLLARRRRLGINCRDLKRVEASLAENEE
jgi:hypothetical protein